MKNNIKKSIFLAVFVFGIFGITNQISANSGYYFQPITNAYSTYTDSQSNQNSLYNNSNYMYGQNYGYNNSYNVNNYNNSNGNVNQNSPTQIVYASDPEVKSEIKNTNVYMPTIKTTSSSTKKTAVSDTTKVSEDNSNKVDTSSSNINTVSGDDTYIGDSNGNNITALSLYGTDRFLPDTIFEWILIFFLILIIIVLFRLVSKKRHHQE